MEKNMIKRILLDMRKIYNMYRLVKIVDRLGEEREKLNPPPLRNSGVDVWHPATSYVKGELVLKCKRIKITPKQATDTVADCISGKNKYLKGYTQKHNGTDVDTLCITESGRDLIDTVPMFPFLKIGLYEALWDKHGKILTGLIGFALGLIPSVILIFKAIMDKQ